MVSNISYHLEMLKWSQIVDFAALVTLKFDGWPWKTIAHLFSATSSFVHHFVAISEFEMEFQSSNAQFGSKSSIFFGLCYLEIWRMTFKFNGNLFYVTSNFINSIISLPSVLQFTLDLQSRNAQIARYVLTFVTLALTFDLDLMHGHHIVNGDNSCIELLGCS